MFIHWFPGHMTKALRMMQENAALVDAVVYVLDARAPLSCVNPAFDGVLGNKPRLYVLNKADLSERERLEEFIDYFSARGSVIAAESLSKRSAPELKRALLRLTEPVLNKYRAKGVSKTVRAMVIGVPNTGKSTLINSLSGEKKTVTGNRPGVTRGKQWISIDRYVELLDSPGVLYPDFKDQEKAVRLALIGSIKEEIVDPLELALEGIRILRPLLAEGFLARYGVTGEESIAGTLEKAGRVRGALAKGGEIDEERAARALISDFRKGYLGKVCLDRVPS